MSTVTFSDKFTSDAKTHAEKDHRSLSKQIEYWASLGKTIAANKFLLGLTEDLKNDPDGPYTTAGSGLLIDEKRMKRVIESVGLND